MTIIDAPDGQYSVVNAASLLASVPAGTDKINVTLPPNATSIAVMNTGANIPIANLCYCLGQTTGILYSGSLRISPISVAAFYARFFTVAPQLDTILTISWTTAPVDEWYVVAMTGVNVVDVPALTSVVGYSNARAGDFSLLVAGTDATDTLRPLLTDSTGQLMVVVSGGVGALSSIESYITANITYSVLATPIDVTSVSLAAGTWLVTARVLFSRTVGSIGLVGAWLGPTSVSGVGAYAGTETETGNFAGGDEMVQLVITKILSLAVVTTVYLEVQSAVSGSVQFEATTATVPNATGITAVKIA